MKAIVAVDEAWGIGKDGKLLTHLPEDMKFFRTVTKGKVVVMGRKTLQSFPDAKPLKNRINIVLTSDDTMNGEGLIERVRGAAFCFLYLQKQELPESIKSDQDGGQKNVKLRENKRNEF